MRGVHRPNRYDFFTIWGNGLPHTDEILRTLQDKDGLELLRIETLHIRNMKRFVFKLYSCDPVPVRHLRSKLKYLFKAKPEIIVIFVRNLRPDERFYGEGAFRHIQCAYVKGIKEEIRDKYNPRRDGQRTEEHVIHASDYEEQVDFFLKMIGHPEGIRLLEADDEDLPFNKPYHITRPRDYTFMTVSISDLKASILTQAPGRGIIKQLKDIEDTPHYRSLSSGGREYQDYIGRYRHKWLLDNHSWRGLQRMDGLSDEQVGRFDPIIVVPLDDGYKILDGVHRVAVTLNHGMEKIRCVVINNG